MNLRSPLSEVRGLGSAKDGVGHWWAQRVTAVALVPLLVWFVASVCAMTASDFVAVREWVAAPLVSILLVLLSIATFYHAHLGLKVVIEDYIHNRWLKISGIALVKFAAIALAVTTIFSIVKIALG